MDEKWYFHDDEQAEILMELSHIIWAVLAKEAVKEIASIGRAREALALSR